MPPKLLPLLAIPSPHRLGGQLTSTCSSASAGRAATPRGSKDEHHVGTVSLPLPEAPAPPHMGLERCDCGSALPLHDTITAPSSTAVEATSACATVQVLQSDQSAHKRRGEPSAGRGPHGARLAVAAGAGLNPRAEQMPGARARRAPRLRTTACSLPFTLAVRYPLLAVDGRISSVDDASENVASGGASHSR